MKRIKRAGIAVISVILLTGAVRVLAASEDVQDKIKDGIVIGQIDVSGMTYDEAKDEVNKYVNKKTATKVMLQVNKDVVETSLKELGYRWSNKDIVKEAVTLGKCGSVIKRYKDALDIKNKGKKYEIELAFDPNVLEKRLKKICQPYNVKAKNASLKATGHGFKIIPEEEGCTVNYEKSSQDILEYINDKWDGTSDITMLATTEITRAKYTTKDCEKVSNEPMGSFTTNFTTGSAYYNRNMNIKNGVEKIDGNILYPGESFSCNEHLVPWTEDNGWYPAGTYVDGGVQDSLGGGICQVSTTLYNALLRAEIKITKRFSHSMAVSYVDLAADAALAGDYKDLVFENNTDAPIYVQGIYREGSLSFHIYGHDTRDSGHSVKYESELVSTTPIKTVTKKDSSKPVGYTETQPGHVGYVAKLWKITYENGKQVKKELLHTSTYAMSPTTIIKGSAKTPNKKDPEKTTQKPEENTTEKVTKKQAEKNTKAAEKETKAKNKKDEE